jgi:hypothetical protein
LLDLQQKRAYGSLGSLLKESLSKNFKRLSRKDQLELLKIFHDAKDILKESDEGHFSLIFKLRFIEQYPPSDSFRLFKLKPYLTYENCG